MRSVRQIFAERLLELALSGDAQHYSALARSLRRTLSRGMLKRLAEIVEGKRQRLSLANERRLKMKH